MPQPAGLAGSRCSGAERSPSSLPFSSRPVDQVREHYGVLPGGWRGLHVTRVPHSVVPG